jgi:hypothetical protein
LNANKPIDELRFCNIIDSYSQSHDYGGNAIEEDVPLPSTNLLHTQEGYTAEIFDLAGSDMLLRIQYDPDHDVELGDGECIIKRSYEVGPKRRDAPNTKLSG